MTNLTLSRVLTTTDLSNGTVVKKVGNLEAIKVYAASAITMPLRTAESTEFARFREL